MDVSDALRLLAALEDEGVDYVLIGSMGMAVHGVVRATRDIDLAVAPDVANVARLRAALRRVFDDDDIDEIRGEDLAGRYPVIRYWPPGAAYSVDVIARLGDAFDFGDLEWEEAIVEGRTVRVATPGMLYRMKRDTLRQQDQADAEALKRRFDLED